MQINRLYFIDALRAFAILMMLQGHFIDSLLATEYRDPSNLIYNTWQYFRGITAPIFFTVSGLIFTYLLMKAKEKQQSYYRMRRGILRGLMLIGIGYASILSQRASSTEVQQCWRIPSNLAICVVVHGW